MSDLARAEALSIYERRKGIFEKIEDRPLSHEVVQAANLTALLGLLKGCAGVLARTFPPHLAFELQRHGIATASGDTGAALPLATAPPWVCPRPVPKITRSSSRVAGCALFTKLPSL